MPQLGETVTEGTITKWFKSVGDQVARDEPLFEVSTDKVDSEVPSPAEGVLTAILVEEGDTVDVGVTLAVIGEVATNGSVPAESAAPEPVVTDGPPAPPPAEVVEPTPAAPVPAPAPVVEQAVPATVVSAATPSPLNGSAEGLVLSPVVRKLLNEHGMDPSQIRGTGLGGRVTRGDVEAAIAQGSAGSPVDGSATPARVPSIADRPSPLPSPAPSVAASSAPAPDGAP